MKMKIGYLENGLHYIFSSRWFSSVEMSDTSSFYILLFSALITCIFWTPHLSFLAKLLKFPSSSRSQPRPELHSLLVFSKFPAKGLTLPAALYSLYTFTYYVHLMVEEMEAEEYRMISPGISAPISPHYDPATLPEH